MTKHMAALIGNGAQVCGAAVMVVAGWSLADWVGLGLLGALLILIGVAIEREGS